MIIDIIDNKEKIQLTHNISLLIVIIQIRMGIEIFLFDHNKPKQATIRATLFHNFRPQSLD